MKHFKTIAFILSVFIISTSCNQRDNFNSLSDGGNKQILGSENPKHQKEIQNLVNQKEIVKIGNKKNRNAVNVSETVGQNNLKGHSKKTSSTKNQSKKVVAIELGVKSEPKEMMFTKNLSLLFYIDNKKSSCLRKFKKYREDFLKYLNKAPHWDIAFSFHRDDKELIKTKGLNNGILSKNRDESGFLTLSNNSVFKNALSSPRENLDRNRRLNYLEIKKLDEGPDHVNHLKGLDQTLKLFEDNKSGQKVVLYFDNDFPYYSAKEWKDFYAKHKNLTILVISTKQTNLKNFTADVDLAPVYGCTENTSKLVSNSLKHILKRLK